nr:sulfotransferase [Pseudenhygromyxa sp. WMMC2535]
MRELERRVALASLEAREPALATIAIERPVVITGFPRTGTSLLLNLLARVEGLWAPPLWQLREPVPPAGASEDSLRAQAQAQLDALFAAAPQLRAIHPMDPDWPDECNWLLRNSFSTLHNAFSWFVPSYVEHLGSGDMRPAYADHRRWLRALVHRRGGAQPRLVLKDPLHLWQLEELFAVYPDATVIHLHRDPDQVAPSLASMCATMQSVDSDAPRSAAEIGAYSLRILERGLQALERSRATLPAARFIDIPYRELIAAPGEVVRRLGRQLEFRVDTEALADAGEWLTANRPPRVGGHRYELEDFGFSPELLAESFSDYRGRFRGQIS